MLSCTNLYSPPHQTSYPQNYFPITPQPTPHKPPLHNRSLTLVILNNKNALFRHHQDLHQMSYMILLLALYAYPNSSVSEWVELKGPTVKVDLLFCLLILYYLPYNNIPQYTKLNCFRHG